MLQTPFDKVIQFLSNNFEILFYTSLALLIMSFSVMMAINTKFIKWKKVIHWTFREFLAGVVILGQVGLIGIVGYLYWLNYQRSAVPLEFLQDVLSNTHWVKTDLRIYFIDGHKLNSIKVNGQGPQMVFEAKEPIREYHFSPDGRYVLVATYNELYLVDRKTSKNKFIDSAGPFNSQEDFKGVVSAVRWAPDSQKFCYEIARWSTYTSQDNLYIYDVQKQKKDAIESPTRRISSLYWDIHAQNLYYLRHEAKDTSVYPYPYEVKVFRIGLDVLQPQLVAGIPFERSSVPMENLDLRGIKLFLEGDQLSFHRLEQQEDWIEAQSAKTRKPSDIQRQLVSDSGSYLGIDNDDYLYFVNRKWFRKRLFKIPRQPTLSDISRYQYKGGDLVVQQMRWLPKSRYVIMQHRSLGVLILEPSTRKIGLLVEAHGDTLGWYQPAWPAGREVL